MARVLDKDLYFRNVERKDRERALRMQYNPGNVFLRSLAQSGAQAGANLVGGLAQGAANYYLLGGKRTQDQADALNFGSLRPAYFEKYHGIAPQQQAGAMPQQRAMPQQPMQRPAQIPMSQPARSAAMPGNRINSGVPGRTSGEIVTMDDGLRVYVPPTAKDAVAKPKAGQPEQKSIVDIRREEQQAKLSAAPDYKDIGNGQIAVKVNFPINPKQSPDELEQILERNGLTLDANGVPYRVLNRSQSVQAIAQMKRQQLQEQPSLPTPTIGPVSFGGGGNFYSSSAEMVNLIQQEAAIQKELLKQRATNERTQLTEKGKNKRKRADNVSKFINNKIKEINDYLSLQKSGDIDKAYTELMDGFINETDPDMLDIYINGMNRLPSQSVIDGAIAAQKEGRGVGRVGSEPRGTSVSFRSPTPKQYLDSARMVQISISKLRNRLAAATNSGDQNAVNAIKRQLDEQIALRSTIVNDSINDPRSVSRVVVDENGDVFVPSEMAKSLAGLGSAPDAQSIGELLGDTDNPQTQTILKDFVTLANAGQIKPDAIKAYEEARASGNMTTIAYMFDDDGNVKKAYMQDPEKAFSEKYPNLGVVSNQIGKNVGDDIHKQFNDAVKGSGLSGSQIVAAYNYIKANAGNTGASIKDLVKAGITTGKTAPRN